MPHSNQGDIIKTIGAIIGLIAIPAFIFQVLTSSNNKSSSATQIFLLKSLNDVLSSEYQLMSSLLTYVPQTPSSKNNVDYFLTATAIYDKERQIRDSLRSLSNEQSRLDGILRDLYQPVSTPSIEMSANIIIPQIKGRDGGIQEVLNWWNEVDNTKVSGVLDPSESSRSPNNCFGMGWNTYEYGYHVLVVFQKPIILTFDNDGMYVKVCIPPYISISTSDVGKIQANWLGKRYGEDDFPWQVIILE